MLAAPIYSVNPNMGADLIIVVFAVVVIGGMGSILGAIVTGFGLGLVRGPDQGLLSRGFGHGDLHHHGHRAADQARRPVRPRELTETSLQEKRMAIATLQTTDGLPAQRGRAQHRAVHRRS